MLWQRRCIVGLCRLAAARAVAFDAAAARRRRRPAPPQSDAMGAVEVMLGMMMGRSLASESVQVQTDTTNWRVLASVLYAEGVVTYNSLKRLQWKLEVSAYRVQMTFRKKALVRRVKKRVQ